MPLLRLWLGNRAARMSGPTHRESPAEDVAACRPTGNPKKTASGIGMPASLYLQQYGDLLLLAFGEVAYQVGSSLMGPTWRDVDVRVMLDPEVYKAMGFGDPEQPFSNDRWCAYVMAFSELGKKMTGLPIDFQIQDRDVANKQYASDGHGRSALILASIRRSEKARKEIDTHALDTSQSRPDTRHT